MTELMEGNDGFPLCKPGLSPPFLLTSLDKQTAVLFYLKGFAFSCTTRHPAGTSPLQSHPPPPAALPLQGGREEKRERENGEGSEEEILREREEVQRSVNVS